MTTAIAATSTSLMVAMMLSSCTEGAERDSDPLAATFDVPDGSQEIQVASVSVSGRNALLRLRSCKASRLQGRIVETGGTLTVFVTGQDQDDGTFCGDLLTVPLPAEYPDRKFVDTAGRALPLTEP